MTLIKDQPQRLIRAVRACCNFGEAEFRCFYPACGCERKVEAIAAAIEEWDRIDGEKLKKHSAAKAKE